MRLAELALSERVREEISVGGGLFLQGDYGFAVVDRCAGRVSEAGSTVRVDSIEVAGNSRIHSHN